MGPRRPNDRTRRNFLNTGLAGAASVAIAGPDLLAQSDQASVVAEIAKQRDATVQALRDRRRNSRAGRVLADRVRQPESGRDGRSGPVVRGSLLLFA